jgi:hypothetical protein
MVVGQVVCVSSDRVKQAVQTILVGFSRLTESGASRSLIQTSLGQQ